VIQSARMAPQRFPAVAHRLRQLLVGIALCQPAGMPAAEQGVVATVHPLATQAAVAAFADGGNAIDAAVAAGLTLGVVDTHNSGIGGGCFLVLRRADGRFVAIDGRETAPAAATRDLFVREGRADTQLSQTGALASAVPGALAAYDLAIREHGKLTLARHLLAAAKVAEEGFPLNRSYALRLEATAETLARFPASKAAFLKPDGSPYVAGEMLVQPDLAATYRGIAREGSGWFYRGPFARRTAEWMQANGGLLTAADFAAYQPKLREPVRSRYRGHEILGMPPPSSGGVHVAQILHILEQFDLKSMGPDSSHFVHTVTEAMKLAFADRAWWLGDPDFAPVPRGLMSRDYAATLARRIHPQRATPVPRHSTPPRAAEDLFQKHTTHFSTADAEGNWVACTATINTSFGSKVVVPGTGVVLNNEMDDFSAQPGVPNAFGLVGNEANAVAPGKRPLSSMSPTLVLKDGRPVLSVGAAGGPTIISQTVLAIVRVIDFGNTPEQALAGPRFHHQWQPDELRVERAFDAKVVEALRARGHTVKIVDQIGVSQAVGVTPAGKFTGAADPRAEGAVSVWPQAR
jgi:gamma-glutamyltranspeptidase / glutathione hydrolase